MALIYHDLNRLASMQTLAMEQDAPLDTVMLVSLLHRTPEPSSREPSAAPQPAQPVAPEPDDLASATWEDAEWQ